MCFTICRNPDFRKVRVAEKNIFVYKILHRFAARGGKSIVQGFDYEVGETYSIPKFTKIKRHITHGFHSWTCKNARTRSILGGRKICKFIIPKGTLYYYNP